MCGIWPIIGIFLIWFDECKNEVTWVIVSTRVNVITVILNVVTFIRFTTVSACPVVIWCQFPGVSQCSLASSERTLLLQAWMSYNFLNSLTLAVLQMLLQPVEFKYLPCSGTRSLLSFSHCKGNPRMIEWSFAFLLFCAFSSALFFPF